MAHFHGIYHGNCALKYVGGVLKVRKLDFRGLKGQIDVTKDNSRGLIAKIDHDSPISATNSTLNWSIMANFCY